MCLQLGNFFIFQSFSCFLRGKAGREEGGEGGRRAIISNSEDISVFLLIYPRDKFHWLIFSLVLVI